MSYHETNRQRFTLEFIARECSESRRFLIDLYNEVPSLRNKGVHSPVGGEGRNVRTTDEGMIPHSALWADVIPWRNRRLAARDALTRLQRIAVGCETKILDFKMVAMMEGPFIVNTTFCWAEFILDKRKQPGFHNAYGLLFLLINKIARFFRDVDGETDYWSAVERWGLDPRNTNELKTLRLAMAEHSKRPPASGGEEGAASE